MTHFDCRFKIFLVVGLLLAAAQTACAPLLPAQVSTQTAIPTAVPSETPLPTPTRIPSPTPTDIQEPTAAALPTALPTVNLGGLSVVHQLAMVDAANGWAVTQNGILHTVDAGQTWSDVTPGVLAGQGAPTTGSFLDAANAALLAVLTQDPAHAIFLRTTDGGMTWTSTTAPFAMGSLQMLDPAHLFALPSLDIGAGQNPVAVYRSDDGGASWTQLFSDDPQNPERNGIPVGGDKNGLAFADLEAGWVSGVTPADGVVYLYRSTDGGQSWAHQGVPLAQGTEKAQFNTQPPRFFGEGKGVLVTQAFLPAGGSAGYASVIYATADNGATWRLAASLPFYGPTAVATASDWFAWTGSRLVATHDGGKTWMSVQPAGLEGVKIPAALEFATPADGWLISVETGKVRLFRTTDGGQNWQLLTK